MITRAKSQLSLNVSEDYKAVKIPGTLITDKPIDLRLGDYQILEFVEIITADNDGVFELITGDEFFKRVNSLTANPAGQSVAELLQKQNLLIPSYLQENDLLFPGTIGQNPERGRFVPCLTFNKTQSVWELTFEFIDEYGVDPKHLVACLLAK